MSQFSWKYVELPCPTCEFPHQFKREAWYDEPYMAVYTTDDMKARKSCKQELFFGVGTYEEFTKVGKGWQE